MPGWYEARDGGVVLHIRVTPRGGADRIEGLRALSDGRTVLALRVKAVPEDGAANTAAARLVAKAVGVAPGQVGVVAGHKARLKTVKIEGEAGEVLAALDRLDKDKTNKGAT